MSLYKFEGALYVEAPSLRDAQRKVGEAFSAASASNDPALQLPHLHPWSRFNAARIETQPCCKQEIPYHDPACPLIIERTAGIATKAGLKDEFARHQINTIYNTVIENIPNGAITVIDKNLRLVMHRGPLARTIVDLPNYELVGKRLEEVFPTNTAAAVERTCRALSGQRFREQSTYNGVTIDVDYLPVFDSDGSVFAALAIAFPVGHHDAVEGALRMLAPRVPEPLAQLLS